MTTVKKTKELTGRHVLYYVLAFFGVIFLANGFFIYHAVNSFTGEDVPKSYRQGLEYNQTLKDREVQNALGWSAVTNTYEKDGAVISVVKFQDENDLILRGMDISAVLRHPSDLAKDLPVFFEMRSDGIYEARLPVSSGDWTLLVTAQLGQNIFETRSEIWLE